MAFEFLKLAGDIYGQRQANRAIKKYNVPTAAERQSAEMYAALADPNSPLLQQFAKQEQDANVSNFLTQIRSMQNADRRQQALGRAPTFFNPERADEAVSFLTSRGLPQMQQQARETAFNRILAAARGVQTNQAPQAGRQAVGMQTGVSNAAYRSTLPARIMDIFSQNRPPLTTGYYGGPAEDLYGPINWNISQ